MAYRATEATEARKQKLKQQLLSNALAIVSEKGFAGLNISALAAASNVATGTLYRYFDNKAELCAELFRIASQREVDRVANAATSHSDPTKCLNEVVATFATRAFKNPRLAWALIAEPTDQRVDSERLHYRKAYAAIFTRLLERGVQQQHFDCDNPALTAAALVGALAESLLGPLSPASDSSQHQQTIYQIQQFCARAAGSGQLPTTAPGDTDDR